MHAYDLHEVECGRVLPKGGFRMLPEYECLRCGIPMRIVNALAQSTYRNNDVCRLTWGGETIGSSIYVCPKCGMAETHISQRSLRELFRKEL